MDAGALGPERAALRRAQLHVRGARRRLRQGKISAGIATLYDALTAAMDWFCASPERRSRVRGAPEALRDERALYAALVQAGVLNGAFDFDRLKRIVDRALETELPPEDAAWVLAGVEAALTQLGVLPFDEGELPPEDPRTF
jgi:hypothetical protein